MEITMQSFLADQLGLEGGKRELLGRGMSGGYDYTPQFKEYAVQNKLANPEYFNDNTPELKQLAMGRMMGKELENKLGSEAEFYDMLNLLSAEGTNMLGISKEQLTRSENLLRGASSEDVKKLQTAMGVTADGLVGPQTYKALVNYGTAYTEQGVRKNYKFLNKDANPTYAKVTDTLHTHFLSKEIEGPDAHVGADNTNLTLPAGIVADSVMVNGKKVTAGSLPKDKAQADAWFKANKDKIDLMTAVKKVDGKTFKAEDYTTYEEFTKDVLDAFAVSAKKKLPKGLDDKYLAAFASSAWNGGTDALTWSGFKTTAEELKKATWDMSNVVAMGKHSYTTGKPSVGLLKRRMQDLNLVLPDDKKLTKVKQRTINDKNGKFSKVEMDVIGNDGSVVRTFEFTKKSINSDQTIDL
jgi:GH24 family phage-related lysozyme (muramidase)